jgi:hypothetical protein
MVDDYKFIFIKFIFLKVDKLYFRFFSLLLHQIPPLINTHMTTEEAGKFAGWKSLVLIIFFQINSHLRSPLHTPTEVDISSLFIPNKESFKSLTLTLQLSKDAK